MTTLDASKLKRILTQAGYEPYGFTGQLKAYQAIWRTAQADTLEQPAKEIEHLRLQVAELSYERDRAYCATVKYMNNPDLNSAIENQKKDADLYCDVEEYLTNRLMEIGKQLTAANARIAELEIEVSTAIDERIACGKKVVELETRLSGQTCFVPPEFQAALDTEEKDAARYRWLRDANNQTTALWNQLHTEELDTFDSAVDAAMQEGK